MHGEDRVTAILVDERVSIGARVGIRQASPEVITALADNSLLRRHTCDRVDVQKTLVDDGVVATGITAGECVGVGTLFCMDEGSVLQETALADGSVEGYDGFAGINDKERVRLFRLAESARYACGEGYLIFTSRNEKDRVGIVRCRCCYIAPWVADLPEGCLTFLVQTVEAEVRGRDVTGIG